jgi:hypothetical protein
LGTIVAAKPEAKENPWAVDILYMIMRVRRSVVGVKRGKRMMKGISSSPPDYIGQDRGD